MRHLNIDISNPIALMSQDMAKSFLFKCDPYKLYQFFMKSTSLEETGRLYHESEQEIKYSQGNNEVVYSIGPPGVSYIHQSNNVMLVIIS